VDEGGKNIARVDLSDKPLIIGRTDDADITLPNPVVSRKHAKIYFENRAVFIEDLKSNNGTFVNGGKTDKTEVRPEDLIRIGPFTLQIIDPTRPKVEQANKMSTLKDKVLSFLSKK
jgi:pSer/pThr/pTyr-binding forkhead associated (FHA) protein